MANKSKTIQTSQKASMKRWSSVILVLTITILGPLAIGLNRVEAADGNLDLSFGTNGKVTTDFLNNGDFGRALAIQNDGKIIVVGETYKDKGDFGLVRYDRTGNLDASFGSGGKVITDFSNQHESPFGVAVQTDGKIIVAGSTQGDNFFSADFALARYDSLGNLDPSFGVGGKVTTDFFGEADFARAVALQNDGKIVVSGISSQSSAEGANFALARYNGNGSLDTSFGVGGKVSTDFSSSGDNAYAMALQSDGKIILGGQSNLNFALARYQNNGSLDSGFGLGGKVTTDFLPGFGNVTAIALYGDGRIAVAGYTGFYNFALARYHSNGNLDSSFGTGGKVISNFSGGADYAFAIHLQRDGKIIAAGESARPRAFSDFALARYDNTGNLDPSFGVAGIQTTDFAGSSESIHAVALQSDGKLLVAGEAYQDVSGGFFNFALARFEIVSFDLCLQDDSNGNLFQLNSITGEYQFTNCSGFSLGGAGTLTRRGNTITLKHETSDRRVTATIDTNANRATASIQALSGGRTYAITDRNILNNPCACR
jgi:uncharacterized delta-60 repeat protein